MNKNDVLDENLNAKNARIIREDLYVVILSAIILVASFSLSGYTFFCGLHPVDVLIVLLSTGGFIVIQYLLNKKKRILRWLVAITLAAVDIFLAVMFYHTIC